LARQLSGKSINSDNGKTSLASGNLFPFSFLKMFFMRQAVLVGFDLYGLVLKIVVVGFAMC
jgi:hypothetical protein